MADAVWAIGLMSGTSLDGIDAALIKTDGRFVYEFGESITRPMPADLREEIRGACRGEGNICLIENRLTEEHVAAVEELLAKTSIKKDDIKIIGFHGQTIMHKPQEGYTWQIGNGSMLATKTGIDVVCDFRSRDVADGGEGAPLVPLYHAALVRDMELPVAVLNIGGIANVTWIGRSEYVRESLIAHDIIAFDTGTGNALIDDWVKVRRDISYDADGKIAASGIVHEDIVEDYLSHPYFAKHPPKSLDRSDFTIEKVLKLSIEDGAATLTALTAEAIARAEKSFPAPVKCWLVTGGGRLNPTLMAEITKRIKHKVCVKMVEEVELNGDALEAEAFAFLAVRSIYNMPISLPTTTGTNHAATGGAFYRA